MKPRLDKGAARGQPTAGFSGLLKTVPGLCELNGLVCVEINLESWSIKELMG